MRNERNPMIMTVNLDGTGLEEAEANWVEVREVLKGRRFKQYRGNEERKKVNVGVNTQMRMIYMFGCYFNKYTEMGKRNPGLYEKLKEDEMAVAGLV